MNMTWTCPIELQESEGFLLSLCMRLHDTARKKADGSYVYTPLGDERIEVVLTPELAANILPHFAYLRHKIRCSPFVFKQEHVPPLIAGITRDAAKADILLGEWSKNHKKVITEAKRDLAALVDAGFRCRG